MLYAINQPVALVGLLIAFLLALTLRVVAMRLTARALGMDARRGPLLPDPREDIDPFGAVAALLVGTGWGRPVDTGAMPRWASRGRRAAVVAAGPLTPLFIGLLGVVGFQLAFPDTALVGTASSVLRGVDAPSLIQQLLISFIVGLLCFGLLNLIPLPPLDGFALLWLSMRHVGAAGEKARYWLVDNNIGVLILLIMSFFPFAAPFLHIFIDLMALPFLWVWA